MPAPSPTDTTRARRPCDEDAWTPTGPTVVHAPVPATDDEADAEMQAATPSAKRRAKLARAEATPGRLTPKQRQTKQLHVALALLTEGYTVNEIGIELGVSGTTVRGWLATYRRKVAAEAIDLDLDQIAVPLAKDNLIAGLLAGDKQYTLETLKGRGRLRTKEAPSAPPEIPALRIEFRFPDPATAAPDVSTVGIIHGTPRAEPKQVGAGRGEPVAPAAEPVGVGVPRVPGGETP